VLLTNAGDADTAATVAGRVLDAIRVPIEVAGRELTVGGGVGIALSHGEDEADAQALLRQAESPCTRPRPTARTTSGSSSRACTRRCSTGSSSRATWPTRSSAASCASPTSRSVQVDSSRVAGVEALLRWTHPVRGEIRPDVFIPIAEETGLIVPIGRWVVQDATARLAEWKRVNPDLAPGHVSVNVGGPQLQDPGLPLDVAEALRRSGLAPHELILEFTETLRAA
jgi:predicted signal transduction protein with EAL and GGDEF domain